MNSLDADFKFQPIDTISQVNLTPKFLCLNTLHFDNNMYLYILKIQVLVYNKIITDDTHNIYLIFNNNADNFKR